MAKDDLPRILQIVPVNGSWKAAYQTDEGEIYSVDLVCWALVQFPDDSVPDVCGMENDETEAIRLCDENSTSFIAYYDTPFPTKELKAQAKELHRIYAKVKES